MQTHFKHVKSKAGGDDVTQLTNAKLHNEVIYSEAGIITKTTQALGT